MDTFMQLCYLLISSFITLWSMDMLCSFVCLFVFWSGKEFIELFDSKIYISFIPCE